MKEIIGSVHDAAGRAAPVGSLLPKRTCSFRTGREARPRIVIVAWRLGGELEQAIRAGHDRFRFAVVSTRLAEDVQSLVEWHRMPLLKSDSFRRKWVSFYFRAGIRMTRIDADLIHTVGPTPVVPNLVDVNTVTFCHAAYREVAAPEKIKGTAVGWRIGESVARRLERWWFERRVRVLAALSESGAADLRRHYPHSEIVVLPRGLDLQRFRPDPNARAGLRRELSVGPSEVVALFVDQERRPLKGLEFAIEGFAAASRWGEGPGRLWVLGSGNERCAPLAQRLGIDRSIRFFDYRTDPERFYQAADIFVLPTAFETFSRSAHEAAACGLPVVAPPVNGIQELIGADEAGIVARRNAADIARALVMLSRDAQLRALLGSEARRRASAFDLESGARSTLDLYQSLLARREADRESAAH